MNAYVQKQNMRSYSKITEKEREHNLSKIQIKDFGFYNRMDSLWNETQRLSPKHQLYSHMNVDPKQTFKKTVRNIDLV